MMKSAHFAGFAAISLILVGCDSEPEETPDITEAIPIDSTGTVDSQASDNAETGAGGSDTDGEPSAQAGPASTSDTMESGSNADGGREPDPSRTKLIPAQ